MLIFFYLFFLLEPRPIKVNDFNSIVYINTAELKRIWDEHELTEAESEHPFEYYFPIRGIYDYSTGGTLAAIRDYPKGLEVYCAT